MPKFELPDIHYQGDLFICDLADVIFKDDMASMEYPIFSLSKNKDIQTRHYEQNNHRFTITPNAEYGLATIFDKDLLIFCISQLIAGLKRDIPQRKIVQIKTYDYLKERVA